MNFDEWFENLPEGRKGVLREDKWWLANAAFEAGKECNEEYKNAKEFILALRMLPEIPSVEVMLFLRKGKLSHPGSVMFKEGKQLQLEHGASVIPPVYEMECAAGMWAIIRSAIIAGRE